MTKATLKHTQRKQDPSTSSNATSPDTRLDRERVTVS